MNRRVALMCTVRFGASRKAGRKPENLGDPINTTGDDLFFVITADGTQAYYASSRDEDSKNLYSIRFTPLSKKTVAEQPKVSLLKGTIFDETSKQPIAAVIEVFDNDKNELIGTFNSNDETGKFLISLPSGKNYGISVSAPDYLFHSEKRYTQRYKYLSADHA